MTAEQTKVLKEIAKWLGIIAAGVVAGGGGALATNGVATRAQADALEPRVVALESTQSQHSVALKDMDGLLRQIDRNVSEIKGELKVRIH